jgi:dTDP-4-amino-4,6-dideoxygalactose transaminase
LDAKLGLKWVSFRCKSTAAALALHHLQKIDEIISIKNHNIEKLDALIASLQFELSPVQRPALWTHGTWYKRPFLAHSADYAKKFIEEGKKRGLRLQEPDSDMGEQVLVAMQCYASEFRSTRFHVDAINLAKPSKNQVVLFDTRDLYMTDPLWSKLEASLKLTKDSLGECMVSRS